MGKMMSLINWFFTWGIRLAKTTWVKMTENQFSLTASEDKICPLTVEHEAPLCWHKERHGKSLPARHSSSCRWTLHPGGWDKRIRSVSLHLAYMLSPCLQRPKSERTKVLAEDFCELFICYTPRDNWSPITAEKIGSSLHLIASLHHGLLG